MVNLSSFIRFHAARSPERIAVVFMDQRITYAELSRRIERTAGYLAAQGIGPDDVVAVMMKNSAAFLELAFAASHLGAVFLPINFRLAADEVEYIAANAGAKLVLADAEFAAAEEWRGDGGICRDPRRRSAFPARGASADHHHPRARGSLMTATTNTRSASRCAKPKNWCRDG